MKKIFLAFTVVLSSLTFFSCSKKSADKTKEELITTGGWRLDSKQTKSGTSTTYTDVTSGVAACKKDDVYVYTSPSTYTVNEGTTKCNPANPDVVATGTWALVNNKEDLRITVGSSSITYNIYLVTENVLTIDETDASGIIAVYTRYTYVH